ncbi:hypothetical protein Q5M85_12830 [Paraclostridium bifermentans]|nr:hypothetical protein [Paraclostridium bifermentans]
MSIEIPLDKYEEAIADFEDRIKEGMTHATLEPKEILKEELLHTIKLKL